VLTRPELAAALSENGRRKAEDLRWQAVATRIIDSSLVPAGDSEDSYVAETSSVGPRLAAIKK
jgi:hypothetical protein